MNFLCSVDCWAVWVVLVTNVLYIKFGGGFFLGSDFICLFDADPVFFRQQSIKSTNKLTLGESPERNAFLTRQGFLTVA